MNSDRRKGQGDDDDARDGEAPGDGDDAGDGDGPVAPTGSDRSTEGLGRTGWLLVGVVFVAFLLVPGVIYLYPVLLGTFGLSFFATYLVLPLIPAIGLGLVGVWLLKR